jgi:hypothetical protein
MESCRGVSTGPRRRVAPTVAAVLVLLCLGCGTNSPDAPSGGLDDARPSGTGSTSSTPTRQASGATPSPRPSHPRSEPGSRSPVVVAISVDGLNPDAISGAVRAHARTSGFGGLAADGAWTLNARTSVEQTHTLPNHTGMMTGLTVSGPSGTGVTFNADQGGTLESVTHRYIPGMFDVAHDHGLHTALLAEKKKFRFLIRSWDATHGAPDQTGADDGRDKVDDALIGPARALMPRLIGDLHDHVPSLLFLHIAAPDSAGHAHGFMSGPYLDAVKAADRQILEVLRDAAADPGLRGRTTVIVTADHGGRGSNHDLATSADNFRIPFFVWGRGVRHASLYALNPQRLDPGAQQPGYDRPRQPIRNTDLADLALALLGLPALPGSMAAGPQVLRVR